MRRTATLSMLLCCVFLTSSCATGSDFVFPDDASRRCFTPCESFHGSCLSRCGHTLFHSHDKHVLLDLLGDVACSADCSFALKQCATRCGGRSVGDDDGPAPSSAGISPAAGEQRQEQLRAQMRRMRWEEMPPKKRGLLLKGCADLYQRVAADSPGGVPPPTCPGADVFQTSCRDLSPEVVRCLDLEVREKEARACRRAFANEDRTAARRMNQVLRMCAPPAPEREPASKPTSRPPAPPPAPPAKQSGDTEDPKR